MDGWMDGTNGAGDVAQRQTAPAFSPHYGGWGVANSTGSWGACVVEEERSLKMLLTE